jgi:hypothetical protein
MTTSQFNKMTNHQHLKRCCNQSKSKFVFIWMSSENVSWNEHYSKKNSTLHFTIRFICEKTSLKFVKIISHWLTISITHQSMFLIWSITCTLILLITKSFKNQLNSKRTCNQVCSIRIKTINISLIVNIVEKNTRIVEMNFAMKINQMMNFEFFDSRKNALYVTNTTVDQLITSKRNEKIRKNVF